MKYYICHKVNNLISEDYDRHKVEYEVRDEDAVEDKRAAVGNEKSSQGISTVDSGKWHNEYVQYVIYNSANVIDSFCGTGSITYGVLSNGTNDDKAPHLTEW